MGCCCRHDQVILLANIHCTGEQRSLPVAILKQLFELIQSDIHTLGLSSLSHHCQSHNTEGLYTLTTISVLWLRKKYGAAQLARRASKETLARLLHQPNIFADNHQNYTRDFFKTQWNNQVNHLNQVTAEDTDCRTKLTKLLEKEESLKRLRDIVHNGLWDTSQNALQRLVNDIEEAEASQRKLSEQLGMLYGGSDTDVQKEKMKLLVWSAKRALYAKAVKIMGVRQPITESRTRGRRVGIKLKEKIFDSIKSWKAAVNWLITQYNNRNEAFLKKFDPSMLEDPNYHALTWDIFEATSLDDPFWNEAHYYHSQGPWAISLEVCEGIRASLMMDWAEEELDLIAQELGRAMAWAVELHNKLDNLASKISNLPPNSNVEVVTTRVGTLNTTTGQQVLMFELYRQLADLQDIMRSWAKDIEWLWSKTRLIENSHPWFDLVGQLATNLVPTGSNSNEAQLDADEMEEAWQEQQFLDDAEDGEEAEDDVVDDMTGEAGQGWETDLE
ncbi:uncharacterized protein PGTG_11870 [Puccinia graminis f. sp. tritici CRL 75-36-700-3]|uniref:Uncharacterized protein n=1 Tax=Puccinia graminis f. sp. tritici (strain CRL 75-36-700-3 / race SCCL) TaxID=418459 RepID=E3KMI9_PUCGT|nr:uncharacterized protein PGTG_11870 [Puccinia graminis f. sp. tritici CRL 75-36-700-3]EFP85514.2 hypothetical protein PGTG_11870 [Puccinia graminis f. sp. tritici CRL 75-36-700-3]